MYSPGGSVASAAYAMLALLQPASLDDLRAATPGHEFPLALSSTPAWFAAAAAEESSLLETAPELLVLAPDRESPDDVDVTGIDLIHVYAPELQGIEDIDAEPAPPPEAPAPAQPSKPRAATQIGLLRELSDLDN